MTSADHNRILGYLHLAYGAFSVLIMIFVSIFMVAVLGAIAAGARGGDAAPTGILAVVIIFVVLIHLVFTAPSFMTAYALLKRKQWARIIGVIAAVVAGLSFPFGTALCVYTLWFLFSANGRELYDRSTYALPPPPPVWAPKGQQREREYMPRTPPDWR